MAFAGNTAALMAVRVTDGADVMDPRSHSPARPRLPHAILRTGSPSANRTIE
jgi:hypothetical protein